MFPTRQRSGPLASLVLSCGSLVKRAGRRNLGELFVPYWPIVGTVSDDTCAGVPVAAARSCPESRGCRLRRDLYQVRATRITRVSVENRTSYDAGAVRIGSDAKNANMSLFATLDSLWHAKQNQVSVAQAPVWNGNEWD